MATRSVGTSLTIGTTEIGELTSIDGLDLSADTIDTTNLSSDGGYREFIGGFKDAGEVSISGFFAPGDAGQKAFYAAFESGAVQTCKITFPSSLGAEWDFSAVVTGIHTSADLEDALSFEGTLKVSGKPTLTLPSGT